MYNSQSATLGTPPAFFLPLPPSKRREIRFNTVRRKTDELQREWRIYVICDSKPPLWPRCDSQLRASLRRAPQPTQSKCTVARQPSCTTWPPSLLLCIGALYLALLLLAYGARCAPISLGERNFWAPPRASHLFWRVRTRAKAAPVFRNISTPT